MRDTRQIKPAATTTYEHTISGLLAKRVALFNEAVRIRDRLGEIKNDVAAIDRVLSALGYKGNLEAHMPRQKQESAVRARPTQADHSGRAAECSGEQRHQRRYGTEVV
jgi:hypothetical protein